MRLTNDRTYLQVKANTEGLKANGFEVDAMYLQYIKLAEYERLEEKQNKTFPEIVTEYQELKQQNARLRESLQRQAMDRWEYE